MANNLMAFGTKDGTYTCFEFRRDDIKTFFGDRAPEVYNAIASYDPANAPIDESEQERLIFAIEAAKLIQSAAP